MKDNNSVQQNANAESINSVADIATAISNKKFIAIVYTVTMLLSVSKRMPLTQKLKRLLAVSSHVKPAVLRTAPLSFLNT